jgi:hypothetical protein
MKFNKKIIQRISKIIIIKRIDKVVLKVRKRFPRMIIENIKEIGNAMGPRRNKIFDLNFI